jgi:hypothetical protein
MRDENLIIIASTAQVIPKKKKKKRGNMCTISSVSSILPHVHPELASSTRTVSLRRATVATKEKEIIKMTAHFIANSSHDKKQNKKNVGQER